MRIRLRIAPLICRAALALAVVPAVAVLARTQGSAQAIGPERDVLARAITVSFANVPLTDALLVLRRVHGVPLAWSGDVVPTDSRVTVSLQETSLRAVLAAMLDGSGLQFVVTRLGTIVIVPLATALGAATRERDGVTDDAMRVAIDRGLRSTGVQQLDQVVVMGSSVGARPERELPVAVQVVSTDRVLELGLPRLTDLARSELPGLILWDRGPTGPPAPFAAVRGVASFTTRAVKTYVDGVELSSPELFTLVDGRSVERLEMIRGPQGAALYGPDALNGIVQLRTRHGQLGQRARRARLAVGAGAYERTDLPVMQPSQDATVGVSLSDPRAAADVSAAYSNVGRDSASRQLRSWNAQVGGMAVLGPVLVEASVRAATQEFAVARIAAADVSPVIPQEITERAIAVTATQQLSARWWHSLVAGRHWIRGDRESFRSPLLPPRLPAGATFERANRSSIRYANTLAWSNAVEMSGGAEYSVRRVDRELTRAAVMNDLSALVSSDLQTTGAFVQTRIRIGSQFIVSGGSRVERLSSVGARQGAVWASTFGGSWNREVMGATMRVRAAWGSGIRPPEPGMSVARNTSTLRQIANPELAPERQQGVEGGADLFFQNGAFFKITGYEQYATDLLQQVSRRILTGVPEAYQFQNVGVVRNRGVELEGGVRRARVAAGVNLHVPRSEVRSLSSRYTGELRPGDRLIEVPEAAGSAYLRFVSRAASRRWSTEVGATMLGPWTGYDWLLLARIERGQATRRDLLRDYWMRYPGVMRPYVAATWRFAADVNAYVRVDNPASNAALIRDNASAPLGRTSIVGVEWRAR